MVVTAERDDTGLWYVSDGAAFVAAASARGALELAAMARSHWPVPGHIWFLHQRSGQRVTVPLPEWQTSEQRRATFNRFLAHLADIGAITLPNGMSPVLQFRPRRKPDGDQV